jgi:hypothetical protein
MIDNELLPVQISLTDNEFQNNCRKLQIYNANYLSKPMMENHLRGEVLQIYTTVAQISGSEEKKLIATQIIPEGTILGLYFGKVYPASTKGLSRRSLDIVKIEQFFNQKGEKIATYLIVGEINDTLTLAATMNHAYSADINNRLYSFINKDAENHAATRNVQSHYFDFTLTQKNKAQHVRATASIAIRNIYPGEALLLAYDDPFTPSPFAPYWESRQLTTLLFTKSGDFLPQHLYSFNKVSKSRNLTIKKNPSNNKMSQIKLGRLLFIIVVVIGIATIANLGNPTITSSHNNVSNSY